MTTDTAPPATTAIASAGFSARALSPARLAVSVPSIVVVTVLVIFVSFAFMSMMSCLVARMNNPMLPRALFGVLNTLLYFPSGAVYPPQGFPGWMQVIAAVDPFLTLDGLRLVWELNRG